MKTPTLLETAARNEVYKSLTSSTIQARKDVQVLTMDAIFRLMQDKKDGLNAINRICKAIVKDAALDGTKYADWVAATVNVRVKDNKASMARDGAEPKFREGIDPADIGMWWKHTTTKVSQTRKFDLDALIALLTKNSEKSTDEEKGIVVTPDFIRGCKLALEPLHKMKRDALIPSDAQS